MYVRTPICDAVGQCRRGTNSISRQLRGCNRRDCLGATMVVQSISLLMALLATAGPAQQSCAVVANVPQTLYQRADDPGKGTEGPYRAGTWHMFRYPQRIAKSRSSALQLQILCGAALVPWRPKRIISYRYPPLYRGTMTYVRPLQ